LAAADADNAGIVPTAFGAEVEHVVVGVLSPRAQGMGRYAETVPPAGELVGVSGCAVVVELVGLLVLEHVAAFD